MASPRISQKMPVPRNPHTLPELQSQLEDGSGRHPNGDMLSAECRLSYGSWCPVCDSKEEHSRRRCKSESVEVIKSNHASRLSPQDYISKIRDIRQRNPDYNPKTLSAEFTCGIPGYRQFLSSCENRVRTEKDVISKKNLVSSVCSNGMSDYFMREKVHQVRSGSLDFNEKIERKVIYSKDLHLKESGVVRDVGVVNAAMNMVKFEESERATLARNLPLGAVDGKRSRQPSESDCWTASNITTGPKRARDDSPLSVKLVLAASCTSESYSPGIRHRSPNAEEQSSDSELSYSTEIKHRFPAAEEQASDSELNDSACDEEDYKDDEGELDSEDVTPVTSAAESRQALKGQSSQSPSHFVGQTLSHISLSDTPKLRGEAGFDQLDCWGDCTIHPALRASLFTRVPPYIRFSSYEEKGPVLPPTVQRLLKWKLSSITPILIRKTILNSGFKLVRKSNEWSGTWGKHMKSVCFNNLRDCQKINHFPGTFQIGRKDRLWKNLFRLMNKFGKKEFGFIPRTYVLPHETKMLRTAWEKNGGKEQWIVKPPASARGAGIKVVHKWCQIPKKIPVIVQKYIANPYLINGSKFDLRLYVLVTSVHPLRIYIYDNGLVRFASVKYSNEMTTLHDRYMHLTNYSINRMCDLYTQNEDASACKGHKWTVKTLWSYLEHKKGVDVKSLWNNLVDLVIKTIISGESTISQLTRSNLASRYSAYEMFGIDVLLDENLKPWLLEVNISPSLHSASTLDSAVKGPLVKDLLNIAGYQIPANKILSAQQEEMKWNLGVKSSLCFDKRLYTVYLSIAERKKQHLHLDNDARADYLDVILKDLTPDDVRHLIQYEDELTQLGNFKKIFPTTITHEYHQFFEAGRYYNMLFDAWETRYHKNRSEGIKLLESMCQDDVHLDTTSLAELNCTKACANQSNSLPKEEREETSAEEAIAVESNDANGVIAEKSGTEETNIPQCDQFSGYKWALSSTVELRRAARPRHGKLGLVTKPFPRSSYISCKTVLRSANSVS